MHYRERAGLGTWREARRLHGLAASQGLLRRSSSRLHALQGEGGPQDLAEARRLHGLAAAQGHAECSSSSAPCTTGERAGLRPGG